MTGTPTDPPIRPLEPEGPDTRPTRDRRGGWGPWLAVAAGMVGILAGLAVGLAVSSEPEVPATTGGTLSSLPPNLAGPGFVESLPATSSTTTTTTTLPPPPTSTTRAEPAPPPTLEQMVPGLEGTMQLAFPDALDEVWRWRIGDPFPERRPLPAGTVHAGFDAGGSWTAALSSPSNRLRPGGGLFLANPELEFQPFEAGVTMFRWHGTEPGRLGWTKIRLDGVVELWTAEIPGPAEEMRAVAELGRVGDGPGLFLAGWGDWGFLFIGVAEDTGSPQLVAYDQDGRPGGSLAADLVALAPDGTMVVSRARNPDGSPAALGLTTFELGEPVPVDWPVRFSAVWADSGNRLASVEPTGLGALLHIFGDGAFQTVLDSQAAFPVGWVLGDRFIVAWAEGVRTRFSADPDSPLRAREVRRPALVFLDVADRSVSAIAVDEIPAEIAFRVAS